MGAKTIEAAAAAPRRHDHAHRRDPDAQRTTSDLLTVADRTGLLRDMLLMRTLEERGLSLFKQGKIPGSFYDGRGQEAISVGATWALGPADPVSSPLIRDLGAHVVKGTDITDILRHWMGRQNPISRGREGNVHFGDRRVGIVGMVSMLPDMMVVATGLAMAFSMRGEDRCALSFFGDGSTSRGDWHEAMNWAAVERLPVIFVLEDNQLAYSTAQAQQFAVDPLQRADGYGIPGVAVDGNDVEAVFAVTHAARQRALAGNGPSLIAARTMRMHGHGAHDDARYVAPELLEAWAERDPIDRQTMALAELGVDTDALLEDVQHQVNEATAAALATPMADPADATTDVFASVDAQLSPDQLGEGRAPWSGFDTGVADAPGTT